MKFSCSFTNFYTLGSQKEEMGFCIVLLCVEACVETFLGGFTEELIQKENASIASRTHQNSYFLEKTLI